MATTITALPPVPSRSNAPDLFADRADAFLGALPTFREELNALGVEIEGAGGDAAAQVALAEAQVALATTQAGIATTQAGLALTRAGDANTSAVAASISAGEALAHANDAEAALTSFELKYLGSKSADPTLDNSGNPLVEGQIYWHSTANELRFYNGSTWTTANLIAANYLVKTGDTITGPSAVSVNSASTAFRITQTGTGNAFVVEDSTSTDATPFVIDANGNMIIGTSQAYSPTGLAFNAQIHTVNSTTQGFSVTNWSTAGASPGGRISLLRANSTTPGTYTASTTAAQYGQIDFWGSDGTKFVEAARITAYPDGTPGADDMPGRIVFSTTADGASTVSEAMRINSTQDVIVGGTASSGSNLSAVGQLNSVRTISIRSQPQINGTVSSAIGVYNQIRTDASAAVTNATSFLAAGMNLGASSSVTNAYGFEASSGLIGATNNYGFYGNIAAATGRWNFYAAGTANNYFNGNTGFGQTSPIAKVDVSGNYASNIVTLSAGVGAIDCSLGNFFKTSVTTGTLTFSFSNVPASRAFSITVEVIHTAGTIAFPASVSFPNSGTAPTLTAGKRHVLGFITSDAGTTWSLVSSTNYNT